MVNLIMSQLTLSCSTKHDLLTTVRLKWMKTAVLSQLHHARLLVVKKRFVFDDTYANNLAGSISNTLLVFMPF